MNSRRIVKARTILAVILTATLIFSGTGLALASHPEASLPGSNFEIDTDANLIVDDPAPSIDWGNVAEIRRQDKVNGTGDEAFGNGTKEDTAVPSLVTDQIPPNKSDLLWFGVYQEGSTNNGFLNLFWSRVQDPTGTTNMDFELNQSNVLSTNNVTPVRTAGDLLIQYDLSNGGTNPQLFLSTWIVNGSKADCEAASSTPCWSKKVDLTAQAKATGSINTSPIADADSDGLGAHSARTFGEAQIDLSVLFPDPSVCKSFGAAYLKSRSSDSFTAALKDFVPPVSINISNCGSVTIIKQDDAGNPLDNATFELYKDNAPVGGSRGAEDTATGKTCTTASGTCTISNVLNGEYWVVETVTPAGYDTAADQHASVVSDTTVTLTFINPRQRGAILVTKVRKHAADGPGDHPQGGVDFTVNGVTKTTDANGQACFDGLLFGSYTVHETTPTGYQGEGDKQVTVDNKASCSDNPYGGESVQFTNTPLSNITITFTSQVAGGTAATISCTGLTATPADSTPNVFDDTSETFVDLVPGTYTCVVVVDP